MALSPMHGGLQGYAYQPILPNQYCAHSYPMGGFESQLAIPNQHWYGDRHARRKASKKHQRDALEDLESTLDVDNTEAKPARRGDPHPADAFDPRAEVEGPEDETTSIYVAPQMQSECQLDGDGNSTENASGEMMAQVQDVKVSHVKSM